jgi:hypothetical protein
MLHGCRIVWAQKNFDRLAIGNDLSQFVEFFAFTRRCSFGVFLIKIAGSLHPLHRCRM